MSLISLNFAVKSIIFPNFGQGPFPKIAGKSPEMSEKIKPGSDKLQKVQVLIVVTSLVSHH